MSLWRESALMPSKVSPTLANAIRVTADDVAWTLGTAVKLMDANTSDRDFIITDVFVEYCDVWDFFYEEGVL